MPFIPLSHGYKAEVDEEDILYLLLLTNGWYKESNGYVRASIKCVKYYMHDIIVKRMGLIKTYQVDHKDRNRLNNKRDNLRLATNGQNKANSRVSKNNELGIKNIRWENNKYRVDFVYNFKRLHIGQFENIQDAIEARDIARKKYFKEFA